MLMCVGVFSKGKFKQNFTLMIANTKNCLLVVVLIFFEVDPEISDAVVSVPGLRFDHTGSGHPVFRARCFAARKDKAGLLIVPWADSFFFNKAK